MEIEMDSSIRVVGIGGTMRERSTSLAALQHALAAAEILGASTELLDLREFDLPIFDPANEVGDYGASVQRFVDAALKADAFLWSTAGYHGTLAGITKNAMDFFEYLGDSSPPYLEDRAVGLIATAGGQQAAVNAVDSMIHMVHSLRGVVVPLTVPVTAAWKAFDADGSLSDRHWERRLRRLGEMTVELGAALREKRLARA